MRIVFMGSSQASATCLRAILREDGLDVVGVVTQPDRPAGRGKTLTPCPCKAFATLRGITEIITPEDVNAPEAMEKIREWNPDVIAVVAFGQFLKPALLDLPPLGCLNCHFSLLPKYRGASPVVAALAAGEKLTGVSVIRMGIGMDDGPVLMQSYEPIYSDVTGGELMNGLAVAGGVTMAKALKILNNGGRLQEIPQVEADATFAHKLKKSDGLIAWDEPVISIERRIRAYSPWPGCFTFLPERFRRKGNTGRVAVMESRIVPIIREEWKSAAPGTVLAACVSRQNEFSQGGIGPVIKCGDTALMLTQLKPEGGAQMDGAAFLRGRQLVPGDLLLKQ